jgi:nucleoid-associated protein YgaU
MTMRRSAILVCATLLCITLLTGCSLFQKKTEMQTVTGSEDMYAPMPNDTATTAEAYDPYSSYPTYGSAAATETTTRYPDTTSGPRYHTVAKKDTLYSLARSYYNDERRWKEIFNANRDEITDPNKIYVGQRLLIP